jgi:hypothetical protein
LCKGVRVEVFIAKVVVDGRLSRWLCAHVCCIYDQHSR